MSSLSALLPSISMCSPTCKLSEPQGYLWRLHCVGTIDEVIEHLVFEANLQPAPLLGGEWGGGECRAEISNPLIVGLAPLAASPHPEALQEPLAPLSY